MPFFVSPACCFKVLGLKCCGPHREWRTWNISLKNVRNMNSAAATLKLNIFGRLSIAKQLNEGYRIGIRKHNEEVTRNRHILSRIIDCVKFCGAFEFVLSGHDESESSDNPGIFRGLEDFVASLDNALKEHLENATVFKGTSKTVQNELLDCMLSVVREHIIKAIFFQSRQMRQWTLAPRTNLCLCFATSMTETWCRKGFLSSSLCSQQELNPLPQHWANVVQAFFFFWPWWICQFFFTKSPKWTSVLDETVAHRLPTSSNVRWNFHSRAVNTVFEHREDLLECFKENSNNNWLWRQNPQRSKRSH